MDLLSFVERARPLGPAGRSLGSPVLHLVSPVLDPMVDLEIADQYREPQNHPVPVLPVEHPRQRCGRGDLGPSLSETADGKTTDAVFATVVVPS